VVGAKKETKPSDDEKHYVHSTTTEVLAKPELGGNALHELASSQRMADRPAELQALQSPSELHTSNNNHASKLHTGEIRGAAELPSTSGSDIESTAPVPFQPLQTPMDPHQF
jgi:hypothetical protein